MMPSTHVGKAVEIMTFLMAIYYLAIGILVILGLVFLIKVIKRYLKNGKLAEQTFKLENEEIKVINERLNKIEALLKDID
jgi:hypothetical protein